MTHAECLDLAASVALDATDAEDARRVEEHAAGCPECARQLDALRETAAALALGVPQVEPPATLQQRVIEAARGDPRMIEAARQEPRMIEAAQQEPRPLGRRLWPRRRRVSPAWLVAAASFLVSICALAWIAILQVQVVQLQRETVLASERDGRYEKVVQVLRSNALAVRPLRPISENAPSSGMVYMDPSTGTGMLMCHNLPPLEPGHAYQVWFVRGNERVSAGMLWPDYSGSGYAFIEVPTDLQSFDSLGLTEEPGKGSAAPTTPRVIGTPLKETSE
jgi:hypothetical protein